MVVDTVALLLVRRILGMFGCGPAPDADAVEIVVLRHQLAILHRQVPPPRWHRELVARRWAYPHTGITAETVQRIDVLGGLIHEYRHAA